MFTVSNVYSLAPSVDGAGTAPSTVDVGWFFPWPTMRGRLYADSLYLGPCTSGAEVQGIGRCVLKSNLHSQKQAVCRTLYAQKKAVFSEETCMLNRRLYAHKKSLYDQKKAVCSKKDVCSQPAPRHRRTGVGGARGLRTLQVCVFLSFVTFSFLFSSVTFFLFFIKIKSRDE